MNVGFVVYEGLSPTTGGFLYDRKLVDTLRANDYHVEIVALPWRAYLQNLAHNLDRGLRERLRTMAEGVDIILQDELCHPSLVWPNRRVEFEVPVVSIVHHLRSSESPWNHSGLTALLERWYLASVDAFVCSSHTTRSAVAAALNRPDVPGTVAYPGGDRLSPQITHDEIRSRAHDDGPLRVVFVGSVVPRKGLDVLLEGLSRLPRDQWELTVIGDRTNTPYYTARITQLLRRYRITDSVQFLGQVPDETLATTLTNSHVIAVPSEYEGFGIVYLEGMGFGLPAIGTTAGGASEVIVDGETGFLVPPRAPAAIADGLRPLLSDREQLTALGQSARDHFDSFPTWTETTNRIREYLDHLVGS